MGLVCLKRHEPDQLVYTIYNGHTEEWSQDVTQVVKLQKALTQIYLPIIQKDY